MVQNLVFHLLCNQFHIFFLMSFLLDKKFIVNIAKKYETKLKLRSLCNQIKPIYCNFSTYKTEITMNQFSGLTLPGQQQQQKFVTI